MDGRAILGLAIVLAGCGGTQPPADAATPEAVEPPAAPAPEGGGATPAQDAAEASPPAPDPACRPSATDGVPPTTEAPCPPATCLESKPGLLATCIDTKHKGCTHYLLARVTPEGTTEPLNVYVRCAGDSEPRATLMKSYAETGVPALPDAAEPPADKACTHIAVHDCPSE